MSNPTDSKKALASEMRRTVKHISDAMHRLMVLKARNHGFSYSSIMGEEEGTRFTVELTRAFEAVEKAYEATSQATAVLGKEPAHKTESEGNAASRWGSS